MYGNFSLFCSLMFWFLKARREYVHATFLIVKQAIWRQQTVTTHTHTHKEEEKKEGKKR